ncbi:hypothetical protein [Solimonas marina]|uniref:DUF2946 domain-containing protein n=1 Tax=Solimonas marina TaxID=2714601 RepID=A0A969WBA9_9GAMM|nr:hypothetical protein [Solimonas marina]NKF23817.1 hypothetical protein [Solimonas marina]
MKRQPFVHFLCALALVATQLFATVHATQHELTAPSTPHCGLCAIAHAPPLPSAAVVAGPVTFEFTDDVAHAIVALTDRRPFARPNSRAPPFHRA